MKLTGLCLHCGKALAIRNPSGYCDHLYYPDNCEGCKTRAVLRSMRNNKIKRLVMTCLVPDCRTIVSLKSGFCDLHLNAHIILAALKEAASFIAKLYGKLARLMNSHASIATSRRYQRILNAIHLADAKRLRG